MSLLKYFSETSNILCTPIPYSPVMVIIPANSPNFSFTSSNFSAISSSVILSILLIISTIGVFEFLAFSFTNISPVLIPCVPSNIKSIKSALFNVSSATFVMCSPNKCLGLCIPGVSINIYWFSPIFIIPLI